MIRMLRGGGRAILPLLLVLCLLMAGCGADEANEAATVVFEEIPETPPEAVEGASGNEAANSGTDTGEEKASATAPEPAEGEQDTDAGEADSETPPEPVEETQDTDAEEADSETSPEPVEEMQDINAEEADSETVPEPVEGTTPPASTGDGRTIVIDPGHQSRANTGKEPLGPGSSEMKTKVSGGTSGVATGVPEYQLVLDIGLALRAELQARGYTVVMTRESNDVDISNVERAQIANNIGAAALIRLHADGSENPATRGCMTICQTASNPYNGNLRDASYALSQAVLNAYSAATGAAANRIWETDTMTGINWAQVPCTIVEMGYMTNAEEDRLMQDPGYQAKMVQGLANGIDAFISR